MIEPWRSFVGCKEPILLCAFACGEDSEAVHSALGIECVAVFRRCVGTLSCIVRRKFRRLVPPTHIFCLFRRCRGGARQEGKQWFQPPPGKEAKACKAASKFPVVVREEMLLSRKGLALLLFSSQTSPTALNIRRGN